MTLIDIFLILIAVFFGVLTIYSPSKYFKLLLFVFAIVPFSYLLDISFSVLSFFRVYIITSLISLLFISLYDRSKLSLGKNKLTLILLFLLLYTWTFFISEDMNLTILVKDIYSLSIFLSLLMLSNYFRKRYFLDDDFTNKIIFYGILIDVIFVFTIKTFDFVPSGSRGEFLLRTGYVRYSDLLSITLFGLCSIKYYLDVNRRSINLFYLTLICVLTLDRIFIFWVLCLFLYHVLNFKTIQGLFVRACIWGMIFLTSILIIGYSNIDISSFLNKNEELANRFYELVTPAMLYDALFFRFMQPAIDGGYDFTLRTLFIGEGPGFLFYIPWFIYRDIEPLQISTDSFIFANFVKYGLIGMFTLLSLIFSFIRKKYVIGSLWIIPYLIVHNGILVDGFLCFLLIVNLYQHECICESKKSI